MNLPVKTAVNMPTSHIEVPGFDTWSWLPAPVSCFLGSSGKGLDDCVLVTHMAGQG